MVSDTISRQAAIDLCDPARFWAYDSDVIEVLEIIVEDLRKLSSAQPEIIRCKDCSRWCICHRSDEWYCADAERREEE